MVHVQVHVHVGAEERWRVKEGGGSEGVREGGKEEDKRECERDDKG